jgi:hypothetical protein
MACKKQYLVVCFLDRWWKRTPNRSVCSDEFGDVRLSMHQLRKSYNFSRLRRPTMRASCAVWFPYAWLHWPLFAKCEQTFLVDEMWGCLSQTLAELVGRRISKLVLVVCFQANSWLTDVIRMFQQAPLFFSDSHCKRCFADNVVIVTELETTKDTVPSWHKTCKQLVVVDQRALSMTQSINQSSNWAFNYSAHSLSPKYRLTVYSLRYSLLNTALLTEHDGSEL